MAPTRKDERLSFRVAPEAKSRLREAARAQGMELTEFVLSAAIVRAEQLLADRTRFELDEDRWAAFQDALDAPTSHKPNLAALLREPSILEQD